MNLIKWWSNRRRADPETGVVAQTTVLQSGDVPTGPRRMVKMSLNPNGAWLPVWVDESPEPMLPSIRIWQIRAFMKAAADQHNRVCEFDSTVTMCASLIMYLDEIIPLLLQRANAGEAQPPSHSPEEPQHKGKQKP